MEGGKELENTSLINKWVQLNESHNEKWSTLILFLLSVSFTLTDWMFGIFTFTEYFFMFIGGCLLVSGNYHIRIKQIKWIVLVLGIIAGNVLMNTLNNDQFVLKIGIAGLIKVAFYIMINIGLYNYVIKYTLEEKLLKMVNVIAVIICLIGFYITIALYSDGILPYEFFWKFTRADEMSYSFNEIENLIRTRSLFSEPSYLGYYLNIIIGLNLFNKRGIKVPTVITLFLTLMVIMTFSYSSIAVLFLIYIMYFFNLNKIKEFKWTKITWLYAGAIAAILFIFRNIIYETLVQRTIDIINGNDYSAIYRIVRSWNYVNKEHIFMGNGMGHTPEIWNIYAYVLSDLGLIAFILFCLFSVLLMIKNFKMGILFIILNFQKGGYLSSAFWIYLLLLFIYTNKSKQNTKQLKE